MNIFIQKLKENPSQNTFEKTIQTIEENYLFTPVAFKNGELQNLEGQNNGSCKIFAFAQANQLSKDETLACFGAYYFEDVLKNPSGDDHQNIRNFMKYGWEGIHFENPALHPK